MVHFVALMYLTAATQGSTGKIAGQALIDRDQLSRKSLSLNEFGSGRQTLILDISEALAGFTLIKV